MARSVMARSVMTHPISDDPISDGPISDDPTSDGPISDDPTSDGPISDDSPISDGRTSDAPISAIVMAQLVMAWGCAGPKRRAVTDRGMIGPSSLISNAGTNQQRGPSLTSNAGHH